MKTTTETTGDVPDTNVCAKKAIETDDAFEELVELVHDFLRSSTEWQLKRTPDAQCCGATGCRHGEHLAQLSIPGYGKRVLCPRHTLDLLARAA